MNGGMIIVLCNLTFEFPFGPNVATVSTFADFSAAHAGASSMAFDPAPESPKMICSENARSGPKTAPL